jgi:predicted RNase H-like HicB family nuclease
MATKHYIGIAEQGPDNWGISFPAFTGTITIGDNFADLIRHAKDALATIVEAMIEEGLPLPPAMEDGNDGQGFDLTEYERPRVVMLPVEIPGEIVRLNITMDNSLVARLDDLAKRQGGSRSGLLARGARLVLAADADA